MPFAVGCFAPALVFGALTLRAAPHFVERVNTFLTVAILAGFGLLCRNVISGGGHMAARLVGNAHWSALLPSASGAWALPVFLSVLQFGAAVPVIVQSMKANRGLTNARKTRRALGIGAALPLLLGLLWTAVTASAPPLAGAGGAAADPVLALLLGPRAIALPVQTLSAGAIGTTLIGAYLTLDQLFRDILSPRLATLAVVGGVVGPAMLGLAGPSLYLPLLGASGYATSGLDPSRSYRLACCLACRLPSHPYLANPEVPAGSPLACAAPFRAPSCTFCCR